MAVSQMLMYGAATANLTSLTDYVAANWHRFYKGEMVSTSTQVLTAGNIPYPRDANTTNSYMIVNESYSLADVPLSFANSTVFYQEYKVDPFEAPQGGLSSAAPFSPTFGITTNTIINGNSGANTVYQEQHPDVGQSFYFDNNNYTVPPFLWYQGYRPIISRNVEIDNVPAVLDGFGLQTRSLTVANVPYDCRTIRAARFHQNGLNTFSNSPSILVIPGSWTLVADSGATQFTLGKVGEWDNETIWDAQGFIMNTTTPAQFTVKAGDLVIGTTMGRGVTATEIHPIDVAAGDNPKTIYSWTRRRVLNGNMFCAHGMSLWFSTVDKTYTVSRAIDQYPACRFLVYRYNPSLAPPVPAPAPPPPPPPSGTVGGSGDTGRPNDDLQQFLSSL